jgi:hypothetical protein
MDLKKTILSQRNKAMTTRIVKYVGDDQQKFDELLKIFLEGDYRSTRRSGWSLGDIVRANPRLARKGIPKLLKTLTKEGVQPVISRNILRIFERSDIPEKYCGPVLDACYKFIRSETVPVAIRAFSITTAANICIKFPELKEELKLTLNELTQFPQTPAIKVRVRDAMKSMEARD